MQTGLLLNPDAIQGPAIAECGRQAEANGFDTIRVPEIFGREPFVTAATLLAATQSIRVGTAIANVYVRDPMATRAAAATLADIYDNRFSLGLGVSNVVGNRGARPRLAATRREAHSLLRRHGGLAAELQGPGQPARLSCRDRLLDALVALGPLSRVREKLAERREHGATGIIVIPLNLDAQRAPDWQVLKSILVD